MKKCENCGNENNGDYGSGRFCSIKCSRGFSTKAKRSEINAKVSKKMTLGEDVTLNCKNCDKEFKVRPCRSKQRFCSTSCSAQFSGKKNASFFRELAKKTGLGGNRNSYAYGWYDSPFAGRVFLESSYELKVAKDLDKNGIKWIRPKPLNYDKNKYYPDFYLIDYDSYLDPKNNFLIEKDKEKIKKVEEQNNVKITILNRNQLSWESIKSLLSISGDAPVL